MTTVLPFPPLDPPMLPAWVCPCGKSSVGVCCWNCRQPRPAGGRDGENGAVDGGGAECYDSLAFGASRVDGGKTRAQSSPNRVEAVTQWQVDNSAHLWAGDSAPPCKGLPTRAQALGCNRRSDDGPMAFKGF